MEVVALARCAGSVTEPRSIALGPSARAIPAAWREPSWVALSRERWAGLTDARPEPSLDEAGPAVVREAAGSPGPRRERQR